jgi:hypothetical protein
MTTFNEKNVETFRALQSSLLRPYQSPNNNIYEKKVENFWALQS